MIGSLAVAGLLMAAPGHASSICEGRLLSVIEADGSVSTGSLNAVRDHASKGGRFRVGWEIGRPGEPPIVTHWQDALFVTLFEDHIFVQVGDLHGQNPIAGTGHIELPANRRWNSSLGTNGRLVTRVSDRPDAIDQKVKSFWCKAE